MAKNLGSIIPLKSELSHCQLRIIVSRTLKQIQKLYILKCHLRINMIGSDSSIGDPWWWPRDFNTGAVYGPNMRSVKTFWSWNITKKRYVVNFRFYPKLITNLVSSWCRQMTFANIIKKSWVSNVGIRGNHVTCKWQELTPNLLQKVLCTLVQQNIFLQYF